MDNCLGITYSALVVEVRFFPAGGRRSFSSGVSSTRGVGGYYFSSSSAGDGAAWYVFFNTSNVRVETEKRTIGYPLRCVAQ